MPFRRRGKFVTRTSVQNKQVYIVCHMVIYVPKIFYLRNSVFKLELNFRCYYYHES